MSNSDYSAEFQARLAELRKPPHRGLDTLIVLCEQGPVFDGDVPSKAERDEFVKEGYAARISVKGEQGYNAATYKGNNLYTEYYEAATMAEAKATRIAQREIRSIASKAKL